MKTKERIIFLIVLAIIGCVIVSFSGPKTREVIYDITHLNLKSKHTLRQGNQSDAIMVEKVKEMTRHAWNGYRNYAWGADELKPLSKGKMNWRTNTMYFTAIDSLDTLYIMGLHKEYQETKDLVLSNMDVSTFDEEIIVFEVTIRVLGGLLSAYDFDPDKRYIEKAVQVADLLLKAFDTNTGIPTMYLNMQTGKQGGFTTGIATMGTLQLEFQYLSDITQDPKYQDAVFFAMDQIRSIDKPHPGLFPTHVRTGSLEFDNNYKYGIGADVDSFYEYLLKIWISTGEPKFRQWYDEAAEAVTKHLMIESGDVVFFPDKQHSHSGNSFHHLTCFTGGMFGLGATSWKRGKWTFYLDVARRATDACWEGYKASKYGIGGEIMSAYKGKVSISSQHFTLRPETIESIFYMWRISHDPVYREYGSTYIDALERHARDSVGYHGFSEHLTETDRMESFFLAETLKYLYLLYSSDDLIVVDEYVFNTEAHPISVRGYGRRKDPSKWVHIKNINEYANTVGKLIK
ncbi:hypothetical protein HDV06_002340 [Boothiomyces sp. JEL0866]|nr:hypothetical protein HDV06_002340 [Boothiomyces sp. JEL0866]